MKNPVPASPCFGSAIVMASIIASIIASIMVISGSAPAQQSSPLPATTIEPATIEPATIEPATIEPATIGPATIEPATITALKKNGAIITGLGRHGSLDGWFVELKAGSPYTAYTTKDALLIVGTLYDNNGDSLTARQIRAADIALTYHNPAAAPAIAGQGRAGVAEIGQGRGAGNKVPEHSPLDRLKRLALQSRTLDGIKLGSQGPSIQAFVDPLCPYSRKFVEMLERQANAGVLQATLIPVSLWKRSATHAIAIGSSDQGLSAWKQYRPGVRVGAQDMTAAGADRINNNNRVFQEWGARGVPFSVIGNQEGADPHHLSVYYGKPASIAKLLRKPAP